MGPWWYTGCISVSSVASSKETAVIMQLLEITHRVQSKGEAIASIQGNGLSRLSAKVASQVVRSEIRHGGVAVGVLADLRVSTSV